MSGNAGVQPDQKRKTGCRGASNQLEKSELHIMCGSFFFAQKLKIIIKMEQRQVKTIVNSLISAIFQNTKMDTLKVLRITLMCEKQTRITDLMLVQSGMMWEKLESSLNALRKIDLISKEVEKRISKFAVK